MANSSIYAAFERMWQHVVSIVGNKSDVDHSHDDKYYTESEIDVALEEVRGYADTAASNVKNDLLNGAGEAYDTLKELGELIDENVGAIEALETVATGKADKDHKHAISDVTNLQASLDAKADQSSLEAHANDTTKHVTDAERAAWNAKSDFSGDYNDLTNKPTIPSIDGLATVAYVDEVASGKADKEHAHDDRYYTELEIDEKISVINTSIDRKNQAINKKISNISKTITEQDIDTAFNDIFGGE